MKGPTVNTITHWIGGKPARGTSTRTAPVYNPATGAPQAEVLLASKADADAAGAVAARASRSTRAPRSSPRVGRGPPPPARPATTSRPTSGPSDQEPTMTEHDLSTLRLGTAPDSW